MSKTPTPTECGMADWLLSDVLIAAGAAAAVLWHGGGERGREIESRWHGAGAKGGEGGEGGNAFGAFQPDRVLMQLKISFGLCMSQIQAWLPGSSAEACQAFSFVKDGVLEPWTCILLVLLLKIQWPGTEGRRGTKAEDGAGTVVVAFKWLQGQLQGSFGGALKQFDGSSVHLSPAATVRDGGWGGEGREELEGMEEEGGEELEGMGEEGGEELEGIGEEGGEELEGMGEEGGGELGWERRAERSRRH
eukprot:392542-Hanusia_phi.AAC.3